MTSTIQLLGPQLGCHLTKEASLLRAGSSLLRLGGKFLPRVVPRAQPAITTAQRLIGRSQAAPKLSLQAIRQGVSSAPRALHTAPLRPPANPQASFGIRDALGAIRDGWKLKPFHLPEPRIPLWGGRAIHLPTSTWGKAVKYTGLGGTGLAAGKGVWDWTGDTAAGARLAEAWQPQLPAERYDTRPEVLSGLGRGLYYSAFKPENPSVTQQFERTLGRQMGDHMFRSWYERDQPSLSRSVLLWTNPASALAGFLNKTVKHEAHRQMADAVVGAE